MKLINFKKAIVGDGLGNCSLERSVVVSERRIHPSERRIAVDENENCAPRSVIAEDEVEDYPSQKDFGACFNQ